MKIYSINQLKELKLDKSAAQYSAWELFCEIEYDFLEKK